MGGQSSTSTLTHRNGYFREITMPKGRERKQSRPNLRYNPAICVKGLRKTPKYLNQDSRCPDRDSNRASLHMSEELKRESTDIDTEATCSNPFTGVYPSFKLSSRSRPHAV